MALQPGTAISSNLRLVRMLGRGSMGSVWIANHLALHTEVAVKFMSATTADDPVLVERFTREAHAAARLKSPHVVKIFDHGVTDEGQPYIVMELLDGEPLFRRFKRDGPLSLKDLVQVVTQVCKALASAHEVGVVHRDIKPSNIFLTDSGGELFVKVLDFGVAKLSSEHAIDMTTDGNVLGTPGYMSPEQFSDASRVDFRTDLWSLGVVAYLALTGQRPFPGKTVAEVFRSVERGKFVPPSTVRHDLSPDIDAWFAQALCLDRRGRFASAKDMAEQLERAVGFPSVMGSVPNYVASGAYAAATFPGTSVPPERGSLFGSKRSVIAIGAAIALGVAGTVLGMAYLVGYRTPGAAASDHAVGEPKSGSEGESSNLNVGDNAATPATTTGIAGAAPTADGTGGAASAGTGGAGHEQPARAERDKRSRPGAATRPTAQQPASEDTAASSGRPPTGGPPASDDRTKRAGEELGI